MSTLITNGTIVNEGKAFKGSVRIEADRIAEVAEKQLSPRSNDEQTVDATGCIVMPGVIDTHVHFREPGLTEKADISSESRAAAYGGVTTFFDMPNTVPTTTTIEALNDKFRTAHKKSHVNYSFFFGATNSNADAFHHLDRSRIPGIKLFMGSSTGNMLVDRYGALLNIFRTAAQLGLQLVAHCEDPETISRNMAAMQKAYGDDPPVALHPIIRSEEACLDSSALAIELARTFGTRLHLAHISTEKELQLLPTAAAGSVDSSSRITAEAVVAHLLFSSEDYATRHALIKCNPAVKTMADREALRRALTDGRIATIATDHAPHLLSQKQGGCLKAASGMPMIQFALPTVLSLADEGVLTIERAVELMCHNPARLFRIGNRGFLRKGYKADIAIVEPTPPRIVTNDMVQSKCRWTPLEGMTVRWAVRQTFCNGRLIYDNGCFDETARGETVVFE